MVIGAEEDAADVAALEDVAGIDERAATGVGDCRVVRIERPRLLSASVSRPARRSRHASGGGPFVGASGALQCLTGIGAGASLSAPLNMKDPRR